MSAEKRDWRLDGACVTLPLHVIDSVFFSESPNSKAVETVKALCAGCSVRDQCLELGRGPGDLNRPGIYGGTTSRQRRRLGVAS